MKNSFHSDNFICLINATSQALTLSNDLTQSPSALQSRLIRKVHHIGCIRLIFCVFSIGNASPTITEFTKNWLKGWTLSTPFPFQLVALIFSFGGVTAESDKAENGQRWGRGILKKRWPVCEEGDFGVIRRKKLRLRKMMLSLKMECLRRSRVLHFQALLLISFQSL